MLSPIVLTGQPVLELARAEVGKVLPIPVASTVGSQIVHRDGRR